jgi:hypothetical protein
MLNKFDRILPKFIDDSSSRKSKFYALVNTLAPQVYTMLMSFMCMFGSHDSIKSTNNLMVILYILVMGGFYVGIQWSKDNKPEFYEWANSPQDIYNPIINPDLESSGGTTMTYENPYNTNYNTMEGLSENSGEPMENTEFIL